MQKVINILSIFLVIVCAGVSFIYFNDDMDVKIPFLREIFLGIAVFLGFLLLIKMSSRWQALFLGLRSKGYALSPFGFRKIIVYEGIMLLYFGFFGYLMLKYIDLGFWLGIVGCLFFIEGVTHLGLYFFAKPYKILVNDKSITVIANALSIVKWSEVQKIDSRQNDIHIMREDGSQQVIDLDWLYEADKNVFIDHITKLAQEKNIYCSIACRGSYKDFAKLAMQRKFDE